MTEDYLATSQAPQRSLNEPCGGQEFIPSKHFWSMNSNMASIEWCCFEFSNEEGSKDRNNEDDDKNEVSDNM